MIHNYRLNLLKAKNMFMTKSKTKFIIIVLLGWLGIHKFMDKNTKMGLVYLFSFGLFGIGWFIDIIKSLFDILSENKENTCQQTNHYVPIEKTPTNIEIQKIPMKPESERNYDLFDKCVDNYYLAYEYEKEIAMPEINAITGNGGKKITFKQEPDNEYDNCAVALYLNETKIGYLYRGRTQEMVNDWIRKGDYFWGYINKIDVERATATFKIGFYKDINSLEMKSFKLTKITKKASEYEGSRFENLECCSDGDIVDYETSYDTDNYIITNEYGNELGELGAKAVEWIEENEDDIKLIRLNNIEKTDAGGYKADIEFFYR